MLPAGAKAAAAGAAAAKQSSGGILKQIALLLFLLLMMMMMEMEMEVDLQQQPLAETVCHVSSRNSTLIHIVSNCSAVLVLHPLTCFYILANNFFDHLPTLRQC